MIGAERTCIIKSICFAFFLIAFGNGFAWAQESGVAAPVAAVEVDPAFVPATPSPPVRGFRPLLTTPPPQTVSVPPAPPPVTQKTVPPEPVAVEEETTPPAILGKAFAPVEQSVVPVPDQPPPLSPPLEKGEEVTVDAAPENQIVSFPVQVKTTSESLDPNVQSGSEPIVAPPVSRIEAEQIKDFSVMVQEAAKVQDSTQKEEKPKEVAQEKKVEEKPVVASDVPIPKRRPKMEQKIAKAKEKIPLAAAPAKIRNMNLSDNPPAVDLEGDHLSQSIADIDADALAAAIDAIDAGRAPKKPPQKAGSAQVRRIDAKPFGRKEKAQKGKVEEEEGNVEENSVVSAAPPLRGETLTLAFAPAAEKLDKAALDVMKSDILPALRQDQTVRALIVAYAAPVAGGDVGSARRLSLSRAVAVRSYLLDKGIEAGRIDVRAQGVSESGAPDRVDVTILSANFFKNRTQ